jgi:predicted nucleic acid-binding protein
MRFWDSSAIVPMLMDEPASGEMLKELDRDPQVVAWWGTETECVSAIARKEREGTLDPGAVTAALDRLAAMSLTWQEVQPHAALRRTAVRLLRVHSLHAADALQLAAATVVADGHPATVGFVTRDNRLAEAARREGFTVLVPGATD